MSILVALSTAFLVAQGAIALEPDVCLPCVDGSAWNGSMMLPTDTSCLDLVMASSGISSKSDACVALQVTAFDYCGCSVAPPSLPPNVDAGANASSTICTVCPDGSDVAEALLIPMAGVTCGFAQAVALDANNDECPDFQVYAAWCQCPNVAPSCTLCPDGSSPQSPSFEIPGLDFTCRELDFIATTLSDGECSEISALADVCDCPPNVFNPTCTLCQDGQPALFPDSILPNGLTCQEVQELASNTTSDHDCDVLKTYAAAFCGCADVYIKPPPCTSVCPDGSPVALPDRSIDVINGNDVTCGRLDKEVDLGIANEKRCQTYFYIGVNFCACDALPVSEPPSCSLCENGMPPPRVFQRVDESGTCGDFAVLAESIDDPRQCTALQATAGIVCGCDNPVSDGQACRLCDAGKPLPDTGRLADPNAGISCSEAEYVGTMAPDVSICVGLQRNYGGLCCAGAAQFVPVPQEGSSPEDTSKAAVPALFLGRVAVALTVLAFL